MQHGLLTSRFAAGVARGGFRVRADRGDVDEGSDARFARRLCDPASTGDVHCFKLLAALLSENAGQIYDRFRVCHGTSHRVRTAHVGLDRIDLTYFAQLVRTSSVQALTAIKSPVLKQRCRRLVVAGTREATFAAVPITAGIPARA